MNNGRSFDANYRSVLADMNNANNWQSQGMIEVLSRDLARLGGRAMTQVQREASVLRTTHERAGQTVYSEGLRIIRDAPRP